MSQTPSSRPLLPLLLSLFLCLGIAACLYLLWQRSQPSAADAQVLSELQSRNAALQAEKARLEALLRQDPCDVARELGLPEHTSALTPSPAPTSVPATVPEAPAAGTVAERVENATVLVLNVLKNGDLGVGSGFFVAPGIVVSNRHVVEGPGSLLVVNKALGKPAPATVLAVGRDREQDYAVLEVRIPPAASVTPLALRGGAKRTEKVSAWGYPTAVSRGDPKFQALLGGRITSIPEVVYAEGVINVVLDRNPPLLAHSAPLSPGNSGGPLVDVQGRVVGINTMITLDDESYRQTSLALGARDLNAFLQRTGVKPAYVP